MEWADAVGVKMETTTLKYDEACCFSTAEAVREWAQAITDGKAVIPYNHTDWKHGYSTRVSAAKWARECDRSAEMLGSQPYVATLVSKKDGRLDKKLQANQLLLVQTADMSAHTALPRLHWQLCKVVKVCTSVTGKFTETDLTASGGVIPEAELLTGQQESDTLTPSVLIELAAAADTTRAQLAIAPLKCLARMHCLSVSQRAAMVAKKAAKTEKRATEAAAKEKAHQEQQQAILVLKETIAHRVHGSPNLTDQAPNELATDVTDELPDDELLAFAQAGPAGTAQASDKS